MSNKSKATNKKMIKACVQSLAENQVEHASTSLPEGPQPATKEDCMRKAAEKGNMWMNLRYKSFPDFISLSIFLNRAIFSVRLRTFQVPVGQALRRVGGKWAKGQDCDHLFV